MKPSISQPFFICGPCAIESRSFALETAEALKGIFADAGLPFLYKSSAFKVPSPCAAEASEPRRSGYGRDHGCA